MYDLNLSVPNISTTKYSDDEKFYLLKNYLYELNETLYYKSPNGIVMYDGGLPISISEPFGIDYYFDAVAGTL